MKIQQHRAKQMLRGDVADDELQEYVEQRVWLTTLDKNPGHRHFRKPSSCCWLGLRSPAFCWLSESPVVRACGCHNPQNR